MTPHMHTMLVSMELGLSSSVLVEMGWVSEMAVRLWRFLMINVNIARLIRRGTDL